MFNVKKTDLSFVMFSGWIVRQKDLEGPARWVDGRWELRSKDSKGGLFDLSFVMYLGPCGGFCSCDSQYTVFWGGWIGPL